MELGGNHRQPGNPAPPGGRYRRGGWESVEPNGKLSFVAGRWLTSMGGPEDVMESRSISDGRLGCMNWE